MTDAQFIAWLNSPSRVLCMLVEVTAAVAGVETTLYLSNTGYVTGPLESPANTAYRGLIVGGGKFSAKLPRDGGAALSVGDIEIENANGDLDGWLDYIWVNRAVRVYVGDQAWAKSEFRQVFDGLVEDLDSRDSAVLNIKVKDKLQRLNTAVSEVKLGGATPNADRLLPLTFGEVHNVTPLLVSSATLTFQVHNGPIESIIEVRDNGVPVSFTPNLAAGTFTLSSSPTGTSNITCSVQGAKPAGTYYNTTSGIVRLLATNYGKDPLLLSELDTTNLSAFDAANPQPLGIMLADRDNVYAVCQSLAASVGAQLYANEAGKLQLLKISLPAPTSGTAVTASDMLQDSFEISERPPVVAGVKLGYCRNWTVQESLQTGIPAAHRDLYAQEWLTSSASDATTSTNYKLTVAPEQTDTYLLVKSDADAEASRRLAIWKVARTVFRYVGLAGLLLEQLGGYQTITHRRFGFSAGKTGQIVGIERDWLNARVTIEVLC